MELLLLSRELEFVIFKPETQNYTNHYETFLYPLSGIEELKKIVYDFCRRALRFRLRIFFFRHFQRCLPFFFQAREPRFNSIPRMIFYQRYLSRMA